MTAIYSIRMRAAQGGSHEQGGRHISGGERMVAEEELQQYTQQLVQRALHHSRGEADFINLTIEKVKPAAIHYTPPLSVEGLTCETVEQGHQGAINRLIEEGVSEQAARAGVAFIEQDNETRGAIIMDADSGQRLDTRGPRGVRVSHLDWDEGYWISWQKLMGKEVSSRIREAIALATKVRLAGSVAELCWSDDPEYVTGYVGGRCYCRIPHLKQIGDERGGRVFYVRQPIDLDRYIDFLENTPVLIK